LFFDSIALAGNIHIMFDQNLIHQTLS